MAQYYSSQTDRNSKNVSFHWRTNTKMKLFTVDPKFRKGEWPKKLWQISTLNYKYKSGQKQVEEKMCLFLCLSVCLCVCESLFVRVCFCLCVWVWVRVFVSVCFFASTCGCVRVGVSVILSFLGGTRRVRDRE